MPGYSSWCPDDCSVCLRCPECFNYDVDGELIHFRLFRCSFCGAEIAVVGYTVKLRDPAFDSSGSPFDVVDMVGVLRSPPRNKPLAARLRRENQELEAEIEKAAGIAETADTDRGHG
jgi:hypothetical protein